MKPTSGVTVEKGLERIAGLLQHILAVQLFEQNVTMGDIAKHLHVSKSSVVGMLRGVKKEKK